MLRKSLFCVVLTLLLFNILVVGQPEIDPSFGKQVHSNGHGGGVKDMIVQSDGKIVMVSGCPHFEDFNFPFCALRLNSNGSYDTSFVGSNNRVPGVVRTRPTPISSASATGETFGVAQQSDGKLILAGYVFVSGSGLVAGLVRYHPDGSVDTTFGTSGFVWTDAVSGLSDRARKVAVQADGKIVIVGTSNNSSDGSTPTASQQFVARYTTSGALDNSFGTGGIYRADFPGDLTSGESIAIQEDGKILAGGNRTGSQSSYILTRLNTNGTLDPTWDGDGHLTFTHTTGSMFVDTGLLAIAVQPDGRIVALGHSNVVYRLNPDSSLDLTFAGVGFRSALQPTANSKWPFDLALSPGGRIIIFGQSQPSGLGYQYETALLNGNGDPDPGFSSDGYLSIDIHNSLNDGGRAVAVDGQGRIVLGGLSALQGCGICYPWSNSSFSATRLLAPVTAVGISGRVTRTDGRPVMNAVLTTVDNTGTTRFARSNPFGYYHFVNLPIGGSYTIMARAKGLVFSNTTVTAGTDIGNLNFVGQPE